MIGQVNPIATFVAYPAHSNMGRLPWRSEYNLTYLRVKIKNKIILILLSNFHEPENAICKNLKILLRLSREVNSYDLIVIFISQITYIINKVYFKEVGISRIFSCSCD